MTRILIGDKVLTIEDGASIEISGDEIRVKPAPQPIYVPLVQPCGPFAPIYPQPYAQPWAPNWPPNTGGTFSVDPIQPTITCGPGDSNNVFAQLDAYALRCGINNDGEREARERGSVQ